MRIKLLTAIITTVLLMSCGPSQNDSAPTSDIANPGASEATASNQSPKEFLRSQYKNALLDCELRTQTGTKLNLKTAPQDSLSWNLLEESLTPDTFLLEGSSAKNHSFTLWLTVKSVRIENTHPVIDLTYRFENKFMDHLGVTMTSTGEGVSSLLQNIENRVFSSESQPDGNAPLLTYFVDLRCWLKTGIMN